jgi:hypothetical protein
MGFVLRRLREYKLDIVGDVDLDQQWLLATQLREHGFLNQREHGCFEHRVFVGIFLEDEWGLQKRRTAAGLSVS